MAISAVFAVIIIGLIVLFLTMFRPFVKEHLLLSILLLLLVNIVSIVIQRTLENNADKKIILKLVEDNKIALCKIQSGTYYTTVKDSVLNKYNLWKLECIAYDEHMEPHNVEIIEKFNPNQKQIPGGYCYMTYDEKEQYFLIPNAVIGNFINLKDRVETYEKKMKSIRYLNVYYQKGLWVETFQETLNKQQKKQ